MWRGKRKLQLLELLRKSVAGDKIIWGQEKLWTKSHGVQTIGAVSNP